MAEKRTHRPLIGISKCLGFAACRYDGTVVRNRFVRKLKKKVKFVALCPEVGIGLGVPRDPIRIVLVKGEHRLVQPATGKDLTRKMKDKCRKILDSLMAVDGFILKSKSPSCGLRDARIFADPTSAMPAGKGAGFFGRAVLKRFSHRPVEDECRLKKPKYRKRFLDRLFGVRGKRTL